MKIILEIDVPDDDRGIPHLTLDGAIALEVAVGKWAERGVREGGLGATLASARVEEVSTFKVGPPWTSQGNIEER